MYSSIKVISIRDKHNGRKPVRNKSAIICAILLSVLFVFGCSSADKTVKEGDIGAIVTTLSEKGITISAQFLDKKMLYDRFGTRNNPFFEYEGNRVIVIDFTMSAGYEVRFRLGKVEVDYLGNRSRPVSRVEFNQYWEELLRNPGAASTGSPYKYRDWSYSTVSKVITENVLPDSLDIAPGPEYRGFLLLEGIQGRYGTAKITINMYDLTGKRIHEFIFLIDV